MRTTSKPLILLALLATIALAGCTSYKNVPYIQNSSDTDLTSANALYDAKIMPKDILIITVVSPEAPEASQIFNLTTATTASSKGSGPLYNNYSLNKYIVSNEGTIDFPMLGTLKVGGMTKTELENDIADRITGHYLKSRPVVTIEMSNYKVTVLGEVTRAGVYTATNGKLNIFEALAMAGDMTIYGKRDCVKVIRENASGEKQIVELNLNDAAVISSPYYQLQQNDIVYVTPNKTKSKNSGIGTETSLWFTSVSILISISSLLYNILK